jgi:hypothetical protein
MKGFVISIHQKKKLLSALNWMENVVHTEETENAYQTLDHNPKKALCALDSFGSG